jgi:hypothetical protein
MTTKELIIGALVPAVSICLGVGLVLLAFWYLVGLLD